MKNSQKTSRKNSKVGQTLCFYCIATHLGGAERSLLDLLKELKAHNPEYTPWVLLPKGEGPLLKHLAAAGVAFEVLPMPPAFMMMSRGAPVRGIFLGVTSLPRLILYLFRLVRLLREKKVVLIHSTGIKCHYLAALVKASTGLPVLWHLRDILAGGFGRWSLRSLAQRLKIRVVANSFATAQAFDPRLSKRSKTKTALGRSDDGYISVVYNGFDPSVYRPKPNPIFRERFKVAEGASLDSPVIGMIGVLARWKGQLDFIEMASTLKEQGLDARYVVVGDLIYDTSGDGDYKTELMQKVRALGLEGCVHFTGFMEDVSEAMNGLDVLVHASNRPEPFGRVIAEAMGCGVPVVASAAGGVLELIEDGKNGLLFPPGQVGELVSSVKFLLDHPTIKKDLIQEGRKVFEQKFSLSSYREGIVRLYRELLP